MRVDDAKETIVVMLDPDEVLQCAQVVAQVKSPEGCTPENTRFIFFTPFK